MRASLTLALALAGTSTSAVAAPEGLAPAGREATVTWMVGMAKAWADQACGGRWVVSELFADDFRGTAPKGIRYGKPSGEPAHDPATSWSKDCSLDEADVRFFGDDVAVMYGAESRTVTLPDGRDERRCLVWTDTWLERNGRWQIIAVQDNRIDCPVKK
ncbi:nuclear transport factor 2 family protein [Dokdonella sp. MW10]|uniref:nuclear transport factor 2 family protein n=1 Tax=Dokdonella sp. MW10 TaxID=2992926 RepID=UPI003F7D91E7